MAILLAFFGMTGSGKSTLAKVCAARWQVSRYNTDQVRKELAGLAPSTRRPDGIDQGIYTREMSARTYSALLARAEADLRAGAALVLLDGAYGDLAERDRVRELAARLGCGVLLIWCCCSEAETMRRLARRAQDAKAVSDGRPEIYRHQQRTFAVPAPDEPGVIRLNTEARPAVLARRLEALPLPAMPPALPLQ